MRAGQNRNFVRIEIPVPTKDKFSAVTVEWQLFNKVWASIEFIKAFEKVAVAASWPTATNNISFRYIKGLLPTMRIVFEDKVYSILGINDVDLRHREVVCICESGAKAL